MELLIGYTAVLAELMRLQSSGVMAYSKTNY